MGGGAQYPYPKHVWSPAGGWWAQPSNWRSNTAVAMGGILAITYAVFNFSADREYRAVAPSKPIPSMRWAKQYQDKAAASEPSS